MKTLYLDLKTGISGDMFLSSLVGAGCSKEELICGLKKLKLSDSYELDFKNISVDGISMVKMVCKDLKPQCERKLKDFMRIINDSELSAKIKSDSIVMLEKLAEVEGEIHDVNREEIHFHELSGIDTLIDIVGVLIAIENLGIDKVYCSGVPIGSGSIEIRHGLMPVPVPSVVELLKGIPVYDSGVKTEIVTPTGALLVSMLSCGFGEMPRMTFIGQGYGAGSRDLGRPNFVRILIGEVARDFDNDMISIIEANVDDMPGTMIGNLFDVMLTNGALDFYVTPIIMKKNRPAYKLSCLINENDVNKFTELFFDHTSTFGVRYYSMDRKKVRSETRDIACEMGVVRGRYAKDARYSEKRNLEYEDLKKISEIKGIPLIKTQEAFKLKKGK